MKHHCERCGARVVPVDGACPLCGSDVKATAIPVARVSIALESERCCFCRCYTRSVTDLPGRVRAEQVPCCEPCADTHRPVQVPGRGAWKDLKMAYEWTGGVPWMLMVAYPQAYLRAMDRRKGRL
jgi:hypothetical protein